MQLTMLKGKIHRATVTHAELHYEGSIAIDGNLLDAAGMREYEQIHAWNVNNGERFVTYALRAEEGSGIISVNGSAAHRAQPGDLIIIAAFVTLTEAEAVLHKPQLVYVDADNRIARTNTSIPKQMAVACRVRPSRRPLPGAACATPPGAPRSPPSGRRTRPARSIRNRRRSSRRAAVFQVAGAWGPDRPSAPSVAR
jgi:aspartate 1-decarboxylase